MIDILLEIAKIGPLVALLIAAIIYFLKREKKNELVVEKLQVELRETEKENLTALYKVLAFVEKMDGKDKGRSDLLLKEIQEFRKSIEEKISALNK